MTTIAFKNGLLVTDSLVSSNDIRDGRTEKAAVIGDHIVAWAGAVEHCSYIIRRLKRHPDRDPHDLFKGMELQAYFIRVDKDRILFRYLNKNKKEDVLLVFGYHNVYKNEI